MSINLSTVKRLISKDFEYDEKQYRDTLLYSDNE